MKGKHMDYLKSHIWLAVFAVFLSILSAIAVVIIPIFIGRTIDLISKNSLEVLGVIKTNLYVLIGLACFSAITHWLAAISSLHFARSVAFNMRSDIYKQILMLPAKTLDHLFSGNISHLILADAEMVSSGLIQTINQFVIGSVTIIATLTTVFIINPYIGLALLLITPLPYLVSKFIFKYNWKYFQRLSEVRASWAAFANEYIKNISTVRLYHAQEDFEESIQHKNIEMAKNGFRAQFGGALINPSTRLINYMIFSGIVLLSSFFAVKKTALSVGIVITLITYAYQYGKPFNDISSVAAEFQSMLASWQRINAFLILEKDENNKQLVLCYSEGKFEIKNLSFGYESNKNVIKDISLSIKPKEHVAIVGETGCGKTTLINLIMRFYDPDLGSILIDGQNIQHYSKDSVRHLVGMVLQDSYLFKASIRDNIRLGKMEATDEQVEEAAKLAYAHDFIMQLEDGYDTIFNEESFLSTGQKQLISIARVILSDPQILILDEATSNIDTRTELLLQKSISALMKDKTAIIVAHRLSTIKNSDKIVVIDDGRIVEEGTHRSLLAKNGHYAKLYKANKNTSF